MWKSAKSGPCLCFLLDLLFCLAPRGGTCLQLITEAGCPAVMKYQRALQWSLCSNSILENRLMSFRRKQVVTVEQTSLHKTLWALMVFRWEQMSESQTLFSACVSGVEGWGKLKGGFSNKINRWGRRRRTDKSAIRSKVRQKLTH